MMFSESESCAPTAIGAADSAGVQSDSVASPRLSRCARKNASCVGARTRGSRHRDGVFVLPPPVRREGTANFSRFRFPNYSPAEARSSIAHRRCVRVYAASRVCGGNSAARIVPFAGA